MASSQNYRIRNSRVGPNNLCVNKSSQGRDTHFLGDPLNFENNGYKSPLQNNKLTCAQG